MLLPKDIIDLPSETKSQRRRRPEELPRCPDSPHSSAARLQKRIKTRASLDESRESGEKGWRWRRGRAERGWGGKQERRGLDYDVGHLVPLGTRFKGHTGWWEHGLWNQIHFNSCCLHFFSCIILNKFLIIVDVRFKTRFLICRKS